MADVSAQYVHYKTSMLCHQDVYKRLLDMRKALNDLRGKSKREMLEDTDFWSEEVRKVREETKQAWQGKLDRLERRLAAQEEELNRLQQGGGDSPCYNKGAAENGRTDSAFEDDDERHTSTPAGQCTRVECDRLQSRLVLEEQRTHQLHLALDQKLVEINKLQITLSKQTKEMIELEKNYLQLQSRYRRGTSKPVVSRICSRSSPFLPKNLCPKPSPPASPPPPTTKGDV